MKITPSNQTLILAGERRGPGALSGGTPGKTAATSAPAGSVLQRVTIVAARPDTTVLYLRADYSPSPDTSSGAPPGTSLAVPTSAGATRDAHGNPYSGSTGTPGISSYLNPVEQYAQTQRILSASARVPEIDVHA